MTIAERENSSAIVLFSEDEPGWVILLKSSPLRIIYGRINEFNRLIPTDKAFGKSWQVRFDSQSFPRNEEIQTESLRNNWQSGDFSRCFRLAAGITMMDSM
jgi:hypothetical protein